MTSVFISELNWKQYDEKVKNGDCTVMLPIGALEQHGPHMSMNPDVLIPTHLSECCAKELGNTLVAPAIQYGYKSQVKSGAGNHMPGTTCIDGKTLTDLIKDLIKAFSKHGNKRFVMVNGHYENSMFIVEGIDLALQELKWSGKEDVEVVLLSYWDFVDDKTIEKLYPEGFTGWDLEHGGVMETSIMMHLHPDLVDIDKIEDHEPAEFPPYDIFPVKKDWVPCSGTLSSAKNATKEKGEILVDVCIKGMVKAIKDAFAK